MPKVISYKKSFNELIKNKTITVLGRYKDSFYINPKKLFFKEEKDRISYELLGDFIADYLNIEHTKYEECLIKTTSREIKGLVSKDYRIPNHTLVKFNKILGKKDMTIDNIQLSLDKYFNNYPNKEEIISRIMDGVVEHYMLDLLLGNIDNGRYNYEIIVGDTNAHLSPYSDFGMIFNYTNTNLRVDNTCDNSVYNNLSKLLENKKYYDRFTSMYNSLNPFVLEDLINKLETNKNTSINDNTKNIIFLSYSRHYMLVRNVLETLRNKNKTK